MLDRYFLAWPLFARPDDEDPARSGKQGELFKLWINYPVVSAREGLRVLCRLQDRILWLAERAG
jgi:hypothetical protein